MKCEVIQHAMLMGYCLVFSGQCVEVLSPFTLVLARLAVFCNFAAFPAHQSLAVASGQFGAVCQFASVQFGCFNTKESSKLTHTAPINFTPHFKQHLYFIINFHNVVLPNFIARCTFSFKELFGQ